MYIYEPDSLLSIDVKVSFFTCSIWVLMKMCSHLSKSDYSFACYQTKQNTQPIGLNNQYLLLVSFLLFIYSYLHARDLLFYINTQMYAAWLRPFQLIGHSYDLAVERNSHRTLIESMKSRNTRRNLITVNVCWLSWCADNTRRWGDISQIDRTNFMAS